MDLLIQPFAGLRPAAGRADDVAAPPYDVLSTEEARVRADGRPLSFLHISKPEIDLPGDTDPYDAAVYAKGAENLQRMIDDGVLIRDDAPAYYVYRMTMDGHVQTGVVGAAPVAAYDENRVRKHEFTRPAQEDDRVRQIDAVDAQTGPVLVVFKPEDRVGELLAGIAAGVPTYDVQWGSEGGAGSAPNVRHTIWAVTDAGKVAELREAFAALDLLYIADGHHRSAAASRVAAARPGDALAQAFLIVAFPADELKILDYNRVVRVLGGLDAAGLLARVGEAFTVEKSDSEAKPAKPHEFGMYLDGAWYRLTTKSPPADDAPALERLDVQVLSDLLLEPMLGIGDPRTDPRIDFVGGIRGLGELERRVDSGEMAAAFALYPTSIGDLMAVADAGEVMPPKSTWFEPKLADGLVSYPLR
ncbi:MAG: DUF1015 family protein [Alphaproteobacteria bacterium]